MWTKFFQREFIVDLLFFCLFSSQYRCASEVYLKASKRKPRVATSCADTLIEWAPICWEIDKGDGKVWTQLVITSIRRCHPYGTMSKKMPWSDNGLVYTRVGTLWWEYWQLSFDGKAIEPIGQDSIVRSEVFSMAVTRLESPVPIHAAGWYYMSSCIGRLRFGLHPIRVVLEFHLKYFSDRSLSKSCNLLSLFQIIARTCSANNWWRWWINSKHVLGLQPCRWLESTGGAMGNESRSKDDGIIWCRVATLGECINGNGMIWRRMKFTMHGIVRYRTNTSRVSSVRFVQIFENWWRTVPWSITLGCNPLQSTSSLAWSTTHSTIQLLQVLEVLPARQIKSLCVPCNQCHDAD